MAFLVCKKNLELYFFILCSYISSLNPSGKKLDLGPLLREAEMMEKLWPSVIAIVSLASKDAKWWLQSQFWQVQTQPCRNSGGCASGDPGRCSRVCLVFSRSRS